MRKSGFVKLRLKEPPKSIRASCLDENEGLAEMSRLSLPTSKQMNRSGLSKAGSRTPPNQIHEKHSLLAQGTHTRKTTQQQRMALHVEHVVQIRYVTYRQAQYLNLGQLLVRR